MNLHSEYILPDPICAQTPLCLIFPWKHLEGAAKGFNGGSSLLSISCHIHSSIWAWADGVGVLRVLQGKMETEEQ